MSAKKLKAILDKIIQLEASTTRLQRIVAEMEANAIELTKTNNN